MSFLFGSAPSVKTSVQPTTTGPQQQALLTALGYLQSGQPAPGVAPYGGQFGAPLSDLQTTSLQGLENVANTVPNTPTFDVGSFLSSYGKALDYGGPPTVSAPTVSAPNVTAPSIDTSNVIQQSVVNPLTTAFNQTILPGIEGVYGRSAGGAFSSDSMEARQQAGKNLEDTIASEAGTIGFQGASTNAALAQQAALANQATGLATSGANATNTLTAGNINTSANLSTQSAILQALGLGPTAATTPFAAPAAETGVLSQTLAGGAVPQQTEQTQLTGQYQDFLNQINQTLQRIGLATSTGTAPTLQPLAVANQGSTGLIPSLLTAGAQGFAQGAGQSFSIANLLKMFPSLAVNAA